MLVDDSSVLYRPDIFSLTFITVTAIPVQAKASRYATYSKNSLHAIATI